MKFVPEQATDFIFSVLAEEWGLLGTSILLCLYFFIIMRCCDIATASRDPLGSFIVLGFVSLFFAGQSQTMSIISIVLFVFGFGWLICAICKKTWDIFKKNKKSASQVK